MKNIINKISESINPNEDDLIVEIGPGKVLAGLIKKIDSSITVLNVFDSASLDATVEALK